MQWDKSANAGFSAARSDKLYIRLDDSSDRPDALSQMNDENSLLSEVRALNKLRAENKALQNLSDIEFISDGYPLVYKRKCDTQSITVIINPSDREFSFDGVSGRILHIACGQAALADGRVTIGGCTAVFIEDK